MLRPIQRLGLVNAVPLFVACLLIELAGCSARSLQPSVVAAVQPQILPAGVKKPPALQNIYIADPSDNSVTIYSRHGALISPTITDGVNGPQGIAVDAYGNFYVANAGDNTVTTYNRDGIRMKPTIRSPYFDVRALTVDANGRIYVVEDAGLFTYNPNGSRTNPTIKGDGFIDVAVDASGKIFLIDARDHCRSGNPSKCTNGIFVRTYDPTGSPSTPTFRIDRTEQHIGGMAVDANGKIYVVVGTNVRTYTSSGSPTTPTISFKRYGYPLSVAVDANGKIYVTSTSYYAGQPYAGTLTTYNPDGSQTTPTITGLAQPFGVAVH